MIHSNIKIKHPFRLSLSNSSKLRCSHPLSTCTSLVTWPANVRKCTGLKYPKKGRAQWDQWGGGGCVTISSYAWPEALLTPVFNPLYLQLILALHYNGAFMRTIFRDFYSCMKTFKWSDSWSPLSGSRETSPNTRFGSHFPPYWDLSLTTHIHEPESPGQKYTSNLQRPFYLETMQWMLAIIHIIFWLTVKNI